MLKCRNVIRPVVLLAIVQAATGCSMMERSHYQVPDYYETGLIPEKYSVGKTYYVKDLRCSAVNGECNRSDFIQHREYEKPYYLSK